MAGPFPIGEQVGHAYWRELPANMLIHDVFLPDKLQLAVNNPLPSHKTEPPDPVVINNMQEWEVETILNSWLHYQKALIHGQVGWV